MCLIKMNSSDQCIARAASHNDNSVPYTSLRPSTSFDVVFLSNDLNRSISNAILATVKIPLCGLSRLSCLIQGNDFCCPHVVGIRKGTGIFAQLITLWIKPPRNNATAT